MLNDINTMICESSRAKEIWQRYQREENAIRKERDQAHLLLKVNISSHFYYSIKINYFII